MTEPKNRPTSPHKPTVAQRVAIVRRNLKAIQDDVAAKRKEYNAIRAPFEFKIAALEKEQRALMDARDRATPERLKGLWSEDRRADEARKLAERIIRRLNGETSDESKLVSLLTKE